MPDRRHYMLDLETLGTAPGSAILSIGAVVFDPAVDYLTPLSQMAERHRFYEAIDPKSAVTRWGLGMDPDTILWWLHPDRDAARAAILQTSRIGLHDALSGLANWILDTSGPAAPEGQATPTIWAHGASFDPPMIEAAFRAIGRAAPWSYKDIRDTRTLFDLAGNIKVDTDHHALRDAWNQARAVQTAMALIGRRPVSPIPRQHIVNLVTRLHPGIAEERWRQISVEGWTPEHDDQHGAVELYRAAYCYFRVAFVENEKRFEALPTMPSDWPWAAEWWKPTTVRRDLEKAGALALAEIERLDRAGLPYGTAEDLLARVNHALCALPGRAEDKAAADA